MKNEIEEKELEWSKDFDGWPDESQIVEMIRDFGNHLQSKFDIAEYTDEDTNLCVALASRDYLKAKVTVKFTLPEQYRERYLPIGNGKNP